MTSLFAESVYSVEEEELAVDENVAEGVNFPIPHGPRFRKCREKRRKVREARVRVAEWWGGKWLSFWLCNRKRHWEKDEFLDILGGIEIEATGESERFTFADILLRLDLLSETIWEGVVDTCELTLCLFSFLILISFLFAGIK